MLNKPETQYKFLTSNFLRGSARGQINSVYRTRDTEPEKVAEYRTAVKQGDVSLGHSLTKHQVAKLQEMGVHIPKHVLIKTVRANPDPASALAA